MTFAIADMPPSSVYIVSEHVARLLLIKRCAEAFLGSSTAGGQRANVGMLPPSDSDSEDEGEEEDAKPKKKEAKGQAATAGQLPPSSSDDDDDEDDDDESSSSDEPLNEYLTSSAPRKKCDTPSPSTIALHSLLWPVVLVCSLLPLLPLLLLWLLLSVLMLLSTLPLYSLSAGRWRWRSPTPRQCAKICSGCR